MKQIRYHILFVLLALSAITVMADDTPRIRIGGSVYGGGREGAIRSVTGKDDSGSTNITIYEGVIGNDATVADGMGCVFGGGYGPAANVLHTNVKFYNGTIMNSLFGGGEIAAVGQGTMAPPVDKIPVFISVERQGTTNVEMYRGHVVRDVFGGGRGYTFASDESASQVRLYTDGYVFGSTRVRIYGGEIGTSEGVADGYGNVFGGGDVGFLYSGNEKKTAGEDEIDVEFLEDGKDYYVIPSGKTDDFYAHSTDKANAGKLSIACDVKIEPQCRVKSGSVSIGGETYQLGKFVPTDALNLMPASKSDAEWAKLDTMGIVIHNAVFAGGNVSTGDDKVYAETTTVYGNVVATVNDLYYRDLITIGTEHTGGLYGDGNLTFVDGYRELNITCYGTDYYSLNQEVSMTEYEKLTTREKAYFQLQYKCVQDNNGYEVGKVITQETYDKLADTYKSETYWVQAGFCSIYAGRLLNTIQRADFAGVFGSRLVLQGAMDRVVTRTSDQVNFADYTINRIGELSFNKEPAPTDPKPDNPSTYLGNYFGIYNQVNYLGGLTSDVRFSEDMRIYQQTNASGEVLTDNDGNPLIATDTKTYYTHKVDNISNSKQKNRGVSDNIMALASGVYLELKQEPNANTTTSVDHWGIITGVIQLELINVTAGEGGGFVYARNEHGAVSRRKKSAGSTEDYVRTFLSSDNTGAATHEEYTYSSSLQNINTSGNFIQSSKDTKQYIVDDCYPNHGSDNYSSNDATKAHYWYVRGEVYAYNQYISAYVGSAKKYTETLPMPLATGVQNGKLQLKAVYPGYYCNIGANDDPVVVGEKEYRKDDPISWWELNKLPEGDPKRDYFSLDTSDYGQELNNMKHDTGFVLTLQFDEPTDWTPTTDVPSPDDPNMTEKGPSYTPQTTGLYGQHYYTRGSYIPKTEVPGGAEGLTEVSGAELCIESWQVTNGGSLLLTRDRLVSDDEINDIVALYIAIMKAEGSTKTDTELENEAHDEIQKRKVPCYHVDESGLYGGKHYTAGEKYNALDGWCMLEDHDRDSWIFNGDALDLLIEHDPENPSTYWQEKPVNLSKSPTETTTLYVSRNSRLLNLKKNKNYTVFFEYTYSEPDGENATVSYHEKHYINITIEFKDELPDVGPLTEPDIVMPGTKISFRQPTVVAGAYNVLGGGWEVYTNEADASDHVNGETFNNRTTPFYWYQDGYWVNYYAQTMVGRKYSDNPVKVRVANYHDLKRVVNDDDNLGVDKTHLTNKRDAKIYVNDYSADATGQTSGLDLLKELYTKSLNNTKMDEHVKGCQNLELILKTDLEPATAGSWTEPIGEGSSQCFEGTLHGDGYTIKGLNASLFKSLCGNVYNLGVTGSFTGSGIADSNSGRIENCWVYTNGEPTSGTKPVANGGTIVNSYYNNRYALANNGGAKKQDDKAFYNGHVAYELNGFYLNKNSKTAEGNVDKLTSGYVEGRYNDSGEEPYIYSDIVFADGIIPAKTAEAGYWEKKDAEGHVSDYGWSASATNPDDYIFFGQKLTYGYLEGEGNDHQSLPGRIGETNRVFRVPAYFQNATMSKAYYNREAVFAAKSKDGTHEVYPNLTAIDFTGYGEGGASLLDHDRLTSFMNADLTQNLLVYSPNDGAKTHNVISSYLDTKEPTYAELTASATIGARSVSAVSESVVSAIKGHAVYGSGTSYSATTDHFLVDGQDFFAPIAYSHASGKRMWYQRRAGTYNYVNRNSGWEVVSLPFTAELVTTSQKGEITHFYKTQAGETYGDESKGHEYWLREYKGTGNLDGDDFFNAGFDYPDKVSSDAVKTVNNTFLWDYYYSKESQQDANSDEYQQYYHANRSYTGYPYIAAGTPYLIGFPGERYYEFDLSGTFVPEHTKGAFDNIAPYPLPQTITFASASGGTIPQSNELTVAGSGNDYDFKTCLVSTELPNGSSHSYVMNDEGSHFVMANDGEKGIPFHPYFTTYRNGTRGILFNIGGEEEEEETTDIDAIEDVPGQLNVSAEDRKIIVKSTLGETVPVRIVNVSGITVRAFNIAPGETVETHINLSGVYIVNHKKIAVR